MNRFNFIGSKVAILIAILSILYFTYKSTAYVYVDTRTDTGTTEGIRNFLGLQFVVPLGYASASASPSVNDLESTALGMYSGYASVSATVGSGTDSSSGGDWLRVVQHRNADGTVESDSISSAGYSAYQVGEPDESRSASASGQIY